MRTVLTFYEDGPHFFIGRGAFYMTGGTRNISGGIWDMTSRIPNIIGLTPNVAGEEGKLDGSVSGFTKL